VPQRLIRIGELRQRRTRMALLSARFAAALAAQRPRRGLGKRRVRRRRLRRIPAVLPQLPSQLGNLSLQLRDPLGLRYDHSSKLLIGRRRISRHHTMINELKLRSTSHAGQDLTSYDQLTTPTMFMVARQDPLPATSSTCTTGFPPSPKN
jgi:hypothetical protein